MSTYIIADVGGTQMRVAASKDLESFGEPVIRETPQSYVDGVTAFAESAKQAADGEEVLGVAVGIPGILTRDKKRIFKTPHLPEWDGTDLAGNLKLALDAPVILENDSALVGLGEAVYGAGKGADILAYITISTGVGGARIVNGVIDERAVGFEPGGQYLFVGDEPRTLEDLVSGTAITKKYGVNPWDIEKDSPVWDELALYAAYGIHNTVLHWSPDRVVIGGSMMKEVGISAERIGAYLRDIMRKFPETPEVVHSSLGNLGGLWGGMAYLKQGLKI